jgi:hypothetical protein
MERGGIVRFSLVALKLQNWMKELRTDIAVFGLFGWFHITGYRYLSATMGWHSEAKED